MSARKSIEIEIRRRWWVPVWLLVLLAAPFCWAGRVRYRMRIGDAIGPWVETSGHLWSRRERP
jgi:hypothetical protein